MNNNKNVLPILGWGFIGFIFLLLISILFLEMALEEIAEEGLSIPVFSQVFSPYVQNLHASTGNGFTGQATAWLFGLSCIPIGIELVSRTFLRFS
jgi:hypothetical protein